MCHGDVACNGYRLTSRRSCLNSAQFETHGHDEAAATIDMDAAGAAPSGQS
jgi:hypothetical protein